MWRNMFGNMVETTAPRIFHKADYKGTLNRHLPIVVSSEGVNTAAQTTLAVSSRPAPKKLAQK